MPLKQSKTTLRYLQCTLLLLLALLSACRRSIDSPISIPLTPTSTSLTTPLVLLSPTPAQGTSQAAAALLTVQPAQTPTLTTYPRLLAVFNLAPGELLNVRAGASAASEILETFPADGRDIKPTGRSEDSEGMRWLEIHRSTGSAGWVSADFVAEQVPGEAFCGDPRLGQLLDQFVLAVRAQDGAALARLVSPLHGLFILRSQDSLPVAFKDDQVVRDMFTAAEVYDWGLDPASGLPVSGTFKEIILPGLMDVLAGSATRYCNTLQQDLATGAATAPAAWPFDYAALNYVALSRPAPPGQEQNWRTWAVGIDYAGGIPYLAVLVQYSFTP